MDRRHLLKLIRIPLLAGPLVLDSALAMQESDTIRVEVNLVNLAVSARDARGKLVTGLQAGDFTVTEDGAPQKITHFAAAGDSPLSLGLLADTSGSQEDFLKNHRKHLEEFLKNVMRPADQCFLLCFGNHLRLVAPLTENWERLSEKLKDYQKGKHLEDYPTVGPRERRVQGTAFYDAIYHAADEVLAPADRGRRAMVLFSDAEDNASAHHMMEAIEAAQRTGTVVFGLRYTELKRGEWSARNKYGRGVMERITRETGGLDFDASEGKNIEEAFRTITDILRSSYSLAYTSNNGDRDGSFRKIKIQCSVPGVTVRHKTGYYAR